LIPGAIIEGIVLIGWAENPGPLPVEATTIEAMHWLSVRRSARRGIREIERYLGATAATAED
jgi:hypothetical protein